MYPVSLYGKLGNFYKLGWALNGIFNNWNNVQCKMDIQGANLK